MNWITHPNWTTPRELKAALARYWDRGDILRALMGSDTTFPLRLPLKGPASAELTDQFEAVRAWIADLAAVPQLRLEWREVRHRVQGAQRLPRQVWLDTPQDALHLLAKNHDAERFTRIVEQTRSALPPALPWLARRPLQALEHAGHWPRLLAIVQWISLHPRPGVYLRQVDIPGVHSKFIEAHRAVLAELLDLVLPAEAIAPQHSGLNQFAARYGFLDKPTRIRLRVLDDAIKLLPGVVRPDLTLDAASFAALEIPCRVVFITENETNFLAFPTVAHAIVIFGAGYGWDALAQAQWLTRCTIGYWGDIDTHGFAILDLLRSRFAHVISLLMDRDTLLAHESHWGEEASQVLHDLSRLNPDERALFDDLRDNRIRKKLRLEQERVGFQCLTGELRRLSKQDGMRAWEACQTTGQHVTEDEADAWQEQLEAGQDVEPPACHV